MKPRIKINRLIWQMYRYIQNSWNIRQWSKLIVFNLLTLAVIFVHGRLITKTKSCVQKYLSIKCIINNNVEQKHTSRACWWINSMKSIGETDYIGKHRTMYCVFILLIECHWFYWHKNAYSCTVRRAAAPKQNQCYVQNDE